MGALSFDHLVSATLLGLRHLAPELAMLCLLAPFRPATGAPEGTTDGLTIAINESSFALKSPRARRHVLAHHAVHAALLHADRGAGRDPDLWRQVTEDEVDRLLRGFADVIVAPRPTTPALPTEDRYDELWEAPPATTLCFVSNRLTADVRNYWRYVLRAMRAASNLPPERSPLVGAMLEVLEPPGVAELAPRAVDEAAVERLLAGEAPMLPADRRDRHALFSAAAARMKPDQALAVLRVCRTGVPLEWFQFLLLEATAQMQRAGQFGELCEALRASGETRAIGAALRQAALV